MTVLVIIEKIISGENINWWNTTKIYEKFRDLRSKGRQRMNAHGTLQTISIHIIQGF